MFGWSDTPRDRIADLQSNIRSLDRVLSRMRDSIGERGRAAERDVTEAAHAGYDDVRGYLRAGADRVGEGAAQLRRQAANANLSLDRFAKQLGVAPIVLLGIAVGAGALFAATQFRTSNHTGRRRSRTQARKG